MATCSSYKYIENGRQEKSKRERGRSPRHIPKFSHDGIRWAAVCEKVAEATRRCATPNSGKGRPAWPPSSKKPWWASFHSYHADRGSCPYIKLSLWLPPLTRLLDPTLKSTFKSSLHLNPTMGIDCGSEYQKTCEGTNGDGWLWWGEHAFCFIFISPIFAFNEIIEQL